MVETKYLPKDVLHPQALSAAQEVDVLGKVARVRIAIGEQVLESMLEAPGSRRLYPRPTPPRQPGPVQPGAVVITAVNISPTSAKAGDTLTAKITVKNSSAATLQTQGPDPEFTYIQGQTFYSQNFPSLDGRYRVAIGFDGTASAPLPYRWGLGSDLPARSSTTVTGYIKLTHDANPTNYWAALIREPSTVLNNVGKRNVPVVPLNLAIIAVDVANVRSGPTIDTSVIAQLKYGTELPILGQEKDWYKIKLPDGREGYVAAGWIVGAGRDGAHPIPSPTPLVPAPVPPVPGLVERGSGLDLLWRPVAVIVVPSATVRSGPSIDAGGIAPVSHGAVLTLRWRENDWYRVRLRNGQEGYVAAEWTTVLFPDGGVVPGWKILKASS